MCNENSALETQVILTGLSFLAKIADRELVTSYEQESDDLLVVATKAYQRGKISKNQYLAVINALDEPSSPIQTNAYSESDHEARILELSRLFSA